MKYRPEIDGLRAVAVVAVILFHAGFVPFSGGFVGVDVFFVISGYLITSLIYEEISAGNFSLARFYERRARRILPALYLICLACVPFAYFWMFPSDLQDFSESLIAVNLFVSNVLFWLESGYFDTAAELKPLLHTWSLAIEEQFYIFFPLLLLLLRALSRRFIFVFICAMSLGSLAIAEYGSHYYPGATFYLVPSRSWELGVGALLSIAIGSNRAVGGIVQRTGSLFGLTLICYAIFAFDSATRFPSLWALIPVIGTALVILYASGDEIVGRILSWKPIVGVGLVSYSAYLWHQPLFAFARIYSLDEVSITQYWALIATTFAMAFLSWKYVESPFRNRRVMTVRKMIVCLIPAMIGIGAFGTLGYFENGFPKRAMLVLSKKYEFDNKSLQKNSWNILISISEDPKYEVENNKFDRTRWFNMKDSRIRMLVVGNSHSKDMFNDLFYSKYAQEKFQIARYGAQIRYAFNAGSQLFDTPNYKDAQIVMLVSKYGDEDVDAVPEAIRTLIRDKKKPILVKNIFEFKEANGKTLSDVIIRRLASSYDLGTNGPVVSRIINERHFDAYENFETENTSLRLLNERIEGIGQDFSSLVLDRMDYICSATDKLCYAINDEYQKYLYDYGHHTLEGASFFGSRIDSTKWLEQIVESYSFDSLSHTLR